MSPIAPTIDLRPDHLEIVFETLHRHVPDREVLAFGSRATWTARDHSDLDLAIMGEKPLSRSIHRVLYEEFIESELPFRVDIVDWARVEDYFRKVIRQHTVTLQRPTDSQNDQSVQQKPSLHPKDWGIQRIGEIGKIVGGDTPLTKDASYFGGTIPWLTLNDLSGTYDRRIQCGTQNLSKKGLSSLSTAFLPPETILLTIRAPIGSVAIAANPVVTSEDFLNIIVNPECNPDFLYYWLKANTHELKRHSTGELFNELSKSALEDIQIYLPKSIEEQRAIAHFLGTLDDKIEFCRRMNATLEAMVRVLFKSWFIDFDPVRDKMEGVDMMGVSEEISGVFPNYIEPDGLPVGWRAGTIGENFHLCLGQSPPNGTYDEYAEGMPFFQNGTDFGFRYPRNRDYCSVPISIVKSGDTLVSMQPPVGDINMAWEDCCIGDGLTALRHKSGSVSFTYYSLLALQQELKQCRYSIPVGNPVDDTYLWAIRVIEPSPEMISLWESVLDPLDRRIKNNVSEIRALSNIRDILLPDIISGRIDIRGTEKFASDYKKYLNHFKNADTGHIYNKKHALTSENYVGIESLDTENQTFGEIMNRLIDEFSKQLLEGSRLELAIQQNLRVLLSADKRHE